MRIIRISVFIIGCCLLGSFVLTNQPTDATFALCVLSFVAGGIRFAIGPTHGDRSVTVDAAGIVAAGAALACGPIGAAGPAAMAALGSILLVTTPPKELRQAVYQVGRLPVQAAFAGLVFTALGGQTSSPTTATSFVAAIIAMSTYVAADRMLSTERSTSFYGLSITAGFGFALSGTVGTLPSFAILAPALPLAFVLLMQLRRERKTVQQAQFASQPEFRAEETLPEHPKEEIEPTQTVMLDPVTNLANQRYLDVFLKQEISRAGRFGQKMTVLLIDIDDFTNANSVYGTDMGDNYVKALGTEVRKMLRDYDLVARYKEDEFVVVLPETVASAGFDTACRIHSALSGQVLPVRARFSIGVATFPEYGTTADDLLSSAHHALNRAKFSGKNTIQSCHKLAKAS